MVLKGGAADEPPGDQLGEIGHQDKEGLGVTAGGGENEKGAQPQIEKEADHQQDQVEP